MQPDIEVLCVELTLFQHHCQKNRAEIESIAEAVRLAMEFGRIFPLTSRYYRLIHGTNNISGERTQFFQIKVDQDSDAFGNEPRQIE